MARQKVLTDRAVQKRLKKINKRVERDARRRARRGELTAESLDLYLREIAAGYEHLRVEIRNDLDQSYSDRKGRRAALVGEVENLLNVLGNDAHRLQQAFATTQDLAKEAGLTVDELQADTKISLAPLKKRFDSLEGRDRA